MKKKYDVIKKLIDDLETDVDKFYTKGNKSAGIRLRKKLQEIKILSQEIRNDILRKRNKIEF